MRRNIFLMAAFFLFLSCEEKKVEFIQSKVMDNKFLLKNPPKYKKHTSTIFYKYTSKTEYFIDHLPDPGGFSSYELEDIEDLRLAIFDISICEKDTTKAMGKLYYYGIDYDLLQIDTLIYKCN